MELIQGLETRRSIRGFKADPVPAEILEKILEIATKSPSYMNTQPWEVAVVTGAKRDELSRMLIEKAAAETAIDPDIKAPKLWPVEVEKRWREHSARRFQALGIARDNEQQRKELKMANFRSYDAPCVLIVYIDSALTEWAIYDCGLFSQSLILAAHAYGLGTCLQGAVVSYADAVKIFLGMPKNKRLVIGIAVGYPDYSAELNSYRSTRAEMKDVVRWYK